MKPNHLTGKATKAGLKPPCGRWLKPCPVGRVAFAAATITAAAITIARAVGRVACAVVIAASTAGAQQEEGGKLKQVVDQQMKNHRQGALSQKKVSELAEQTESLTQDYRATLRQIDSLKTHNAQLRSMIQDQKQQMVSVREQIREVKKTRKEIMPFMQEMYNNLKEFVKRDVPFLVQERGLRLQQLKATLANADVSISEKYRKLMEAYQIENDYGKKLEIYQGTQTLSGTEYSVNYLRLGRLVLIYQTLDEKKQAYWDDKQKKWIPLTSRYRKVVKTGIKMARDLQIPTFLTLPVPAPQNTEVKL